MLSLCAAPASLPHYLWLQAQRGRGLSRIRGAEGLLDPSAFGKRPPPPFPPEQFREMFESFGRALSVSSPPEPREGP